MIWHLLVALGRCAQWSVLGSGSGAACGSADARLCRRRSRRGSRAGITAEGTSSPSSSMFCFSCWHHARGSLQFRLGTAAPRRAPLPPPPPRPQPPPPRRAPACLQLPVEAGCGAAHALRLHLHPGRRLAATQRRPVQALEKGVAPQLGQVEGAQARARVQA